MHVLCGLASSGSGFESMISFMAWRVIPSYLKAEMLKLRNVDGMSSDCIGIEKRGHNWNVIEDV